MEILLRAQLFRIDLIVFFQRVFQRFSRSPGEVDFPDFPGGPRGAPGPAPGPGPPGGPPPRAPQGPQELSLAVPWELQNHPKSMIFEVFSMKITKIS